MYTQLPQTSEEFERLDWVEIEPWYRELLTAPLTQETLGAWMAQWSALSCLVDELNWWLEVLTTQNTADQERSARRERFLNDILTQVRVYDQQVKERLLESGLAPEGFALQLRSLRSDVALYREENLPLLNEEKQLGEEYLSVRGGQTVMWDEQEVPITSMAKVLQEPDRGQREAAWRRMMERRLQDREATDEVWVKLYKLREQIARNAGFESFRDYRWRQLYRFDYTPDDCKKFHDAVERIIVPVANELAEKRRQLLGVETVRPWDMQVDPRASLASRPADDLDGMLRQSAEVFRMVDPSLGGYFDTLIRHECFDIDERPNKAPGGYNLPLEVKGLSFIFGRVHTALDFTQLIFHEAGHAFHVFETRGLPYLQQRGETSVPAEFAEVASMSMEYIGAMHIADTGFFTADEARRIRLQQMEEAITWLPILIKGDAFQHWLYEHPQQAIDPEAVSEKWIELERRFQPYLDYSGLEALQRIGWQQTLHFFDSPFYYIEYAFAGLGALQVWRNYLNDPKQAIKQYRHALSLGATRILPKLYEAAGARFGGDPEMLETVVKLVMGTMKELE